MNSIEIDGGRFNGDESRIVTVTHRNFLLIYNVDD